MASLQALRKEWVQKRGLAPEDFLVLVLFVTQKSRAELFRLPDTFLSETEKKHLVSLLKRREQKEPVAYLTGQKEFFGRNFSVGRAVLIPRPESELLIEDIVNYWLKDSPPPCAVFDIGTGSGALIITLEKEFRDGKVRFFGSDTSEAALTVAEDNKRLHQARVAFSQGSFLDPWQRKLKQLTRPVYIIANLPYVSEALYQKTEPDVQEYEPVGALVSKNKGLSHYQALFRELQSLSQNSGVCWIEISPEQSSDLKNEIEALFPLTSLFIGQDLSDRDRFIRFTF